MTFMILAVEADVRNFDDMLQLTRLLLHLGSQEEASRRHTLKGHQEKYEKRCASNP